MRIFIKKISVFIMCFAFAVIVFEYLSLRDNWRQVIAKITDSEELISVNVGSDEIIPYIQRAQQNDDTQVLILGDSVCKQMFDGLQDANPGICILGSNAAIAMSGQYILAKEYIENHKNVTDIYLIALPGSLATSYETKYGYQYTVMPFVKTDTFKFLDDNTVAAMEKVYGKWFMKPFMVEVIDKSAVNRKIYLNMLRANKQGYQQETRFEIADQYIKKIYDLCKEKNIVLHLYSCPISEEQRENTELMRSDYEKSWLYDQYPDYFEGILYYPAHEARDGVHFGGEYATQPCYNEKIKKFLKDSKLLEQLVLE